MLDITSSYGSNSQEVHYSDNFWKMIEQDSRMGYGKLLIWLRKSKIPLVPKSAIFLFHILKQQTLELKMSIGTWGFKWTHYPCLMMTLCQFSHSLFFSLFLWFSLLYSGWVHSHLYIFFLDVPPFSNEVIVFWQKGGKKRHFFSQDLWRNISHLFQKTREMGT